MVAVWVCGARVTTRLTTCTGRPSIYCPAQRLAQEISALDLRKVARSGSAGADLCQYYCCWF